MDQCKEPHVVYGLPEGTYILHEELPPYAEDVMYLQEDIQFEVKSMGVLRGGDEG